jgi:hypothetical protein
MARTRRSCPAWVDRDDAQLVNLMTRGYVKIPIHSVLRNGSYGIDEVWRIEGKRFAKRLRKRALRRAENKSILKNIEEN